ncbi:MAG: PKD domain-containing protein [Bacteroidota bacterium]
MTIKTIIRLLLTLFYVNVVISEGDAAHLIGGVMTYECVGSGSLPNTRQYQLVMRVYRDCAGNGASFDSAPNSSFDATVTIYKEGLSTPFRNLTLDAPTISTIDAGENNPCVIVPPNVCVEEGVYTFPLVELPIIEGNYTVSYQRCCRNATISNINNPGDTGVTYSVEITAAAQRWCNDSPVFDNFPPPVVCAGRTLNFDHAAIDPDGDQLVYELCTPLKGGGTNSTDSSGEEGIAPDPESPPPYAGVSFVLPTYAASQPLGRAAQLRINETTGQLTGQPLQQGQYVVGICVSEYRNGELLSRVRRDFQFNVAPCESLVSTMISADSNSLAQDTFFIRSCGERHIFIENQSTQDEFIASVKWEFTIGNETVSISSWDANLTLPTVGMYKGQLILNPGLECTDTAAIFVQLFPGITADFDVKYDTCAIRAVEFTDRSTVAALPLRRVLWDYGDGRTDENGLQTKHQYDKPGRYETSLYLEDKNGCVATHSHTIDYFPIPDPLEIRPSCTDCCAPADVRFEHVGNFINDRYVLDWELGDGNFSTLLHPLHTYADSGQFSVQLQVVSPTGCFAERIFDQIIDVKPAPVANFTFSPAQPSNFNPTVVFTDQSIDAASWNWTFDESGRSTRQQAVYTFPDTGRFDIRLVVGHKSGCKDSMTQSLDIVPRTTYWLPNAFTPDHDGLNDLFVGKGSFDGMRFFSMHIFNRYGEAIFSTFDPLHAWDGRNQNTGKMVTSGTYIYQVRYQPPRGAVVEEQGTLMLIR